MAVDQQKVKARLRVLFPKANLSQKRIDEISAKLAKKPADDADDTAIDLVITDANDLMDFEAIAKEDDRVRNLEAKIKQPTEPNPTNPPTTDPKPKDDEEAPAWAKAMMQKMEAIEKGEVVKSKQSSILKAFENSDVLKNLKPATKEAWLKRIAISDDLTEDQISEQISALETEYQELTQLAADNQQYAGPTPSSQPTGNISDEEISKLADSL